MRLYKDLIKLLITATYDVLKEPSNVLFEGTISALNGYYIPIKPCSCKKGLVEAALLPQC